MSKKPLAAQVNGVLDRAESHDSSADDTRLVRSGDTVPTPAGATPRTDHYRAEFARHKGMSHLIEWILDEFEQEEKRLTDTKCELAAAGAKLDAIAKALDLPAESWRIAGCDVMAHQITDLIANYRRAIEDLSGARGCLANLVALCKRQGMEVTMFDCAILDETQEGK